MNQYKNTKNVSIIDQDLNMNSKHAQDKKEKMRRKSFSTYIFSKPLAPLLFTTISQEHTLHIKSTYIL